MILTIQYDGVGNDWTVWAQLEPGNPTEQANSLIVGFGATRDEAISSAVANLERNLDWLQDGARC